MKRRLSLSQPHRLLAAGLFLPKVQRQVICGLLVAILGVLFQAAQAQSTATMVVQDFDRGPSELAYTVAGETLQIISSQSASNDAPANANFYNSAPNGAYLDGKNAAGTVTMVTFQPVSLPISSDNYAQFRLAAFGLSPNAGLDLDDFVRVEISPDRGATFYNTLELYAFQDASWRFPADRTDPSMPPSTGIATTNYDGDPTPFQIRLAKGGELSGVDAYSTVRVNLSSLPVTGAPQLSNVTLRVTLFNTARSERWVIDDVVIGNGRLPLPVELKNFTAEATAKGTQVRWATASEKNNNGFEVQRSTNGEIFETIGHIAGNGTSSRGYTYEWLDAKPLARLSYYRLRQIDEDGTESFSPVVTVQRKGLLPEIAFFPNPSKGRITLAPALGAVRYRVMNALGQTVLTGAATGGNNVDMQSLRAGTYFLEFNSEAGRTVQRLIRE